MTASLGGSLGVGLTALTCPLLGHLGPAGGVLLLPDVARAAQATARGRWEVEMLVQCFGKDSHVNGLRVGLVVEGGEDVASRLHVRQEVGADRVADEAAALVGAIADPLVAELVARPVVGAVGVGPGDPRRSGWWC